MNADSTSFSFCFSFKKYNCNPSLICQAAPEAPMQVGGWGYALVGIGIVLSESTNRISVETRRFETKTDSRCCFLSSLAVIGLLIGCLWSVHKKGSAKKRAELDEYYKEQLAFVLPAPFFSYSLFELTLSPFSPFFKLPNFHPLSPISSPIPSFRRSSSTTFLRAKEHLHHPLTHPPSFPIQIPPLDEEPLRHLRLRRLSFLRGGGGLRLRGEGEGVEVWVRTRRARRFLRRSSSLGDNSSSSVRA